MTEGHLKFHGLGHRVALAEKRLNVRGQLQAIAQDESGSSELSVGGGV